MKSRSIPFLPAVASVLSLCVLLGACSNPSQESILMERAMAVPINLDSEQVSLNDAQVSCGVASGLWDDAVPSGGQQSVYHLTAKGRELKFSDDVYANDPEYNVPYTQVRGTFSLGVASVLAVHDGPDASTKLMQASLGVKIPDPCFADPLPLMGVSKGKFTPKVAPMLQLENSENGWMPVKLIH